MKKKLLQLIGIFLIVVLGFFLESVFSGRLILRQSFSLGTLLIHYYGIIMALAVASGFYIAIKRAPKFGLKPNETENILIWITIGGFLGARIYHVISSIQYYVTRPLEILQVWHGGLSIYGAVIGGLLSIVLVRKTLQTTHYNLQTFLNWLTPSLIAGQIIGRFGNFFNYELYGYPAHLPWRMFVPAEFRYPGYEQYNFFHPLFLYEAIGNCIILAVLLIYERRESEKSENPASSRLFLWYVLLYNSLRFGLEFLRIDSVFLGTLRVNALVSAILVAVAVFILISRPHEQVP